MIPLQTNGPKVMPPPCALNRPRVRPHALHQKILGSLLLPILILGFFVPWVGLSVLGCMILGLVIAVRNGRLWCDWMCPRGSFLDAYMTRFSPQKKLPAWFTAYRFRLAFITVLFSFLIFNIIHAWPNFAGVAFAFVKTLTLTTILSIILAFTLRARAWCMLCPVGTFSGLIGGKRRPLKVDIAKCINCTICAQVCPMGLKPYKDKEMGTLQSRDCIKCGTCVRNCPMGALSFS